jgi:FkbM family methyltransferase
MDNAFITAESFKIDFTKQTVDDSEYFLPKYASHRPAVHNLLRGHLYEPKTHEFVRGFCSLAHGSMVHAGTFFGDMLPSFSESVSGKVYAFEPVLENYVLARLCVESNQLSNVVLINAALSERITNLCINTTQQNGKHAGGSSAISQKGLVCTAITIDAMRIEDLVLIQLDVEGHELAALAGAFETINKNRPAIAVEDNNRNCAKFLCEASYDLMGTIPGLTIYAPKENDVYKKKITSLLQ